ncbi:MAG: universal stress protein [Methylibium sp.]|uniref:universal stress protein n=1 Tax=Methylibium sp. TaxID=2067992 RepID=UPI00183259F5|nr:universal stress protein [Methylibium sp.]MBA2722431.1 universal stress protein [Methylibium sp.]MBA3589201.1 universal stress protein [Methylibium sp.]
MKILLPVDGSRYTQLTLGYIAAHDELFGHAHEYTAFTAIAPVPAHAAQFLDRFTLDSYYTDEAEKVLELVRDFSEQHGWKLHTTHAAGHAAEAIAAFAEAEQPDLIVMGTHGNSPLLNVVLGSVASGVLARCKVPVLLIR